MKHKIAVIGGTGFIGKSLAQYLSKTFEVKILDIQNPPEDLQKSVTYNYCDITNYDQVVDNLADVDLVIHTAIVQIPLITERKSLAYSVNILGTQNVCEAVEKNPKIKGMILSGSWHTLGERDLKGVIDETFGFRPDKVEDRARLYALSKVAQDAIVRFYDEMTTKIYGIIRMGTVLGEGMPEKTAANLFIKKGLNGEPLTPYKHSMHRPMLYVDIGDIQEAFRSYAAKILDSKMEKSGNSLAHIVNVYYPNPITILELAEIVKEIIRENTNEKIVPNVEIIDRGIPPMFSEEDQNRIRVDVSKVKQLLGLDKLRSPEESLRTIIRCRKK